MSEGFDFDPFAVPESGEQPAQETPMPETPPEPETVAIPKQEWDSVKQQLEQTERWRQDATRFFAGEQPQQQQADPLTQFIQDPNFLPRALEENRRAAVQEALEQVEARTVIQQFETQYPHLNQYAPYIRAEVDQYIQENRNKGLPDPTIAQAIQTGIDRFQQKVPQAAQSNAVQNQQHNAQRMGMTLDIGRGNAIAPPKTDISQMDDATFLQHWERVKRGAPL